MPEPKPKPAPETVPVAPKTEGGVKSTDAPPPEETGMVTEGGDAPAPRDERPGGMIGEG